MGRLRRRLILAFLLLMVFVPFLNYDNGTRCITAPCDSGDMGSVALWGINGFPYIYGVNYLFLIGGIILTFIIAALIFRRY
ncbi:MAG: hypothetical protein Q8Q04_00460 [archaeon]|nr:hypothetical protein [archaeon]